MTHAHLRTAILVLAALVIAACANPFAPRAPEVSVSLLAGFEREGQLVLRTRIGGRRVDIVSGEAGAVTKQLRAPSTGSVPVDVALFTIGGDSLAAAAFTQTFERDYNHWVSAAVGPHRPLGFCIGTVVATPLRGSSTDTLFVMYGGIPKDAVC